MSRKRGQHAPLVPRYYEDEKFFHAGERAELLYVRILSWCAQSMTDGVVTDHDVALIGRGMKARAARVRSLCEARLMEALPDGRSYRVIAWLDYNPSAEEIRAGRDRDRRRKRAVEGGDVPRGIRPERKGVPRGIQPPTTTTTTTTDSDRTPSGSVRSESARAAPRSAGGAARPAPDGEVESEPGLTPAARKAIEELREKLSRNQRPSRQRINSLPADHPLAEALNELADRGNE